MPHPGSNRTPEPNDRRRRPPISPQDALRYNAHPDQLMAELPREEWPRALRAIEREVKAWEAQQTPEQRRWRETRLRRHYVGTLEAAQAITARLRSNS